MATQYSTKMFFRRAPNAMLSEYFSANGIAIAVDLVGKAETDVEDLHEAWLQLDDEVRRQSETDFRDVQELATELGIANVRLLAPWESDDPTGQLEAMEDDYDRSFWVFLNRRRLFEEALRLQEADRLPSRSWKKLKGLPTRVPASDQATIVKLQSQLVDYFRRAEGRGNHCQVDPFVRAEKHYYFVFAEDHSRAEQDFEGGALQRRAHRPVFEVVFLYDSAAGTLDTYAQGGVSRVRDLQSLFMSVALSHDVEVSPKDERVYELNLLADPSFNFVYGPASRITAISVRKLRLSLPRSRGHRISIEAPTQPELYERYARIVASLGESETTSISHAELQVSYAEDGGRRPRTRTFALTAPDRCSLGQDERDGLLREMLIESGIDPSGLGRDARRR